jgi:hypothetical protein
MLFPNRSIHGTQKAGRGSAIRLLIVATVVLLASASCARPARYVFIPDNGQPAPTQYVSQRYICLKADDANRDRAILSLETTSAVEEYLRTRTETRSPVEEVLVRLMREDYDGAAALLEKQGDELPAYLRLLVKADLAYEAGTAKTSEIVALYQSAYEAQPCDINREFIKLRIRQVRYKR